MRIVIRVDSSTRMGHGHLMRCLTLAEMLREHDSQVVFVCRDHPGNNIALVQNSGFPALILPPTVAVSSKPCDDYAACLGVSQADDAEQTIEALNGETADWLIVDHYGLDVTWEKKLRFYCIKLMVIDDLENRLHDCDLLLDQNFSLDCTDRYESYVPSFCQLLLGPRYALLRKEFKLRRQQKSDRSNQLKNLLVFFTAGDDQGETLKALQGIAQFGKAEHVDVVVGPANADNARIQEVCSSQNWGYHCQIDYMPALIAQADLVIGAGGSSNWERCALAVPALVVILAENQAVIVQALDEIGVVMNLGCHTLTQPRDYEKALNRMTALQLASLSGRAGQLVDAEGAPRVVEILLQSNMALLKQGK